MDVDSVSNIVMYGDPIVTRACTIYLTAMIPNEGYISSKVAK